jgi:hypothetical protein
LALRPGQTVSRYQLVEQVGEHDGIPFIAMQFVEGALASKICCSVPARRN